MAEQNSTPKKRGVPKGTKRGLRQVLFTGIYLESGKSPRKERIYLSASGPNAQEIDASETAARRAFETAYGAPPALMDGPFYEAKGLGTGGTVVGKAARVRKTFDSKAVQFAAGPAQVGEYNGWKVTLHSLAKPADSYFVMFDEEINPEEGKHRAKPAARPVLKSEVSNVQRLS